VTWTSDAAPPQAPPPGLSGWLRVGLRGGAVVALIGLGMLALLLIRAVEAPTVGAARPVSGHVNRIVSRLCLAIVGLRWRVRGRPMRGPGAVVANHASWLDILALNAALCVVFVAKSDVAGWPGIGPMARLSGTLFVVRRGREAAAQTAQLSRRLAAGQRLALFAEGTSTDGQRVLPFKPTLFAAFADPQLPSGLQLQPVSLRYTPPPGADPRFYGWWGDMPLGPHLLAVLAAPRHGAVTVILHDPVPVAAGADRKALAARCEAAVRAGMAG